MSGIGLNFSPETAGYKKRQREKTASDLFMDLVDRGLPIDDANKVISNYSNTGDISVPTEHVADIPPKVGIGPVQETRTPISLRQRQPAPADEKRKGTFLLDRGTGKYQFIPTPEGYDSASVATYDSTSPEPKQPRKTPQEETAMETIKLAQQAIAKGTVTPELMEQAAGAAKLLGIPVKDMPVEATTMEKLQNIVSSATGGIIKPADKRTIQVPSFSNDTSASGDAGAPPAKELTSDVAATYLKNAQGRTPQEKRRNAEAAARKDGYHF